MYAALLAGMEAIGTQDRTDMKSELTSEAEPTCEIETMPTPCRDTDQSTPTAAASRR
jgi:hypothetical protein